VNDLLLNPQTPVLNTQNRNLFLAKSQVRTEPLSPAFDTQELSPLIKLIAQRLQIPELMAFKLIRKFIGSGQISSFNELKDFLMTLIEANTSSEQNPVQESLIKQFKQASSEARSERELDKAFKPLLKELTDQYQATKTRDLKNDITQLFSPRATQVPLNPQLPMPAMLSSPKAFASWLVNNKAAFITLKTNPQLTYLLLALNNPQIHKSPVLMAEIVKLLAQLIKLRQGKGLESAAEDDTKTNLDYEFNQEAHNHEHNIVNTVKQTFENITINPMREFLIEAERFAEEEIANLWSLTLKKEKELEKQIMSGLKDFRAKDN
jgi:hypothetical protein